VPTYEYECTSCHRRYEVFQRFSDTPLETCEVCGGKLKRVYHPVGVVLKGSGFYSTDNRSGKSLTPGTKESSSDGTSGSEKSGGDKSGSDTKKTPDKQEKKPAAKKESGGSGSAAL